MEKINGGKILMVKLGMEKLVQIVTFIKSKIICKPKELKRIELVWEENNHFVYKYKVKFNLEFKKLGIRPEQETWVTRSPNEAGWLVSKNYFNYIKQQIENHNDKVNNQWNNNFKKKLV
jgi:hypothetical protein